VVKSNLQAIDLHVEIKVLAGDFSARMGVPGAAYDMVLAGDMNGGGPQLSYPDPGDALVRLLGGENARKPSGNTNFAYFDNPAYDRRMAAADRLTGFARFRAFSRLDADIMRDQAPWAPLYDDSGWRLVSQRVGCLKVQPVIGDLAAMCLRR